MSVCGKNKHWYIALVDGHGTLLDAGVVTFLTDSFFYGCYISWNLSPITDIMAD